jgi:thioredoxin-related protein
MIQLLLSFVLMFHPAHSTWLKNIDTAKTQAKTEHKYILLNFSGSDWCIPCMKLEQDIFNSAEFNKYAADNLVLVNADFPRKSKNQLSKQQQKDNDALADKYNQQGSFPFTILLDGDGNKIKVWDGYYKNGPGSFVNEIKVASGKD